MNWFRTSTGLMMDVIPATIMDKCSMNASCLMVDEQSDGSFCLADSEGVVFGEFLDSASACSAGETEAENREADFTRNMVMSAGLDASVWTFREGEDGPEFFADTSAGRIYIFCTPEDENSYAGFTALFEDGKFSDSYRSVKEALHCFVDVGITPILNPSLHP